MTQKKDNAIAAAIIASLAAIFSSILFTYAQLPEWAIVFAYILLIIQLCILLYIIGIPEKLSKLYRNLLERRWAKKIFEEFKDDDYVGKFQLIQSPATGEGGQFRYQTFHNVIDELKQRDDFRGLQEPNLEQIRAHFTFWIFWYNRFKGKWYNYFIGKDASVFEQLLREFEAIVNEYYKESVTKPLKAIKEIKERNPEAKIEPNLKENWRIAMGHYDAFEDRYTHFVGKVNSAFRNNLAMDIEVLGGIPPARELDC